MVYTLGLAKHANIRYRDSMNRLRRCELVSMLHALSVDCEVTVESLGGADFLTFECRPLSAEELSWISGHSAVVFMGEKTDGLLRPLVFTKGDYLDEDLPEILKYKGKTSAQFTRMMINIALSLSPFLFSGNPLCILDPVCGKGTGCFCALQAGMNAIGMDADQKAVREAADYFSKYLQYHSLKHSVRSYSETAGKTSVQVKEFSFSDTREHFRLNDTRFLRLGTGDTVLSPALCRRTPVHLLVADLPYGIQHAPQFGRKPESFSALLSRVLPSWKKSLLPGGVAAVSFNTLTFPTQQVISIARSSGFTPVEGGLFSFLRHEVEQAVVRDVVFMINKPLEGGT